MPTDFRIVHIDQKNNLPLGYVCDERESNVPLVLEKPDNNDYLTDEESDEAADFEIKVPELDSLINQFEGDDEVVLKEREDTKEYALDLKGRGFEPEERYDITNKKANRQKLLDKNVQL
mmetsp:Transcript_31597/g.48311  ORF Transcript_31597/g.48311 Transcript_31597/m.48311 type:complete len:119 (-) Transcript_31597:97-453(-)